MHFYGARKEKISVNEADTPQNDQIVDESSNSDVDSEFDEELEASEPCKMVCWVRHLPASPIR
jgi:hypothetical protein